MPDSIKYDFSAGDPVAKVPAENHRVLAHMHNDIQIIGHVKSYDVNGAPIFHPDPNYFRDLYIGYKSTEGADPVVIPTIPCYRWDAQTPEMTCTLRSSSSRGTSPAGTLALPAAAKFKAIYISLLITAEDSVAWRLDASGDEDSVQLACEHVAGEADETTRTWLTGVIDSAGVWQVGPSREPVRCGRES